MSESATDRTCNHSGCKCKVEQGKPFCSDYCEKAATEAGQGTSAQTADAHRCGCGHPACA